MLSPEEGKSRMHDIALLAIFSKIRQLKRITKLSRDIVSGQKIIYKKTLYAECNT